MKISNEITCTKARTVPIIAYLDWLNNPTKTKNILLNNTSIKGYKTRESTDSSKNIEGPHIKFCEKTS